MILEVNPSTVADGILNEVVNSVFLELLLSGMNDPTVVVASGTPLERLVDDRL